MQQGRKMDDQMAINRWAGLRADNMSALEERATVMLWAALHRQDIGAVQNMIRDGVDVNEPDINGMTPLLVACYIDSIDLVAELLRADACVNSVNNTGHSALYLAAKNGNNQIVDLLLNYKPRVNAMSKFSGMTALHEASHKGHHQVVQTLLEHGADVNALDKMNKMPEFYATNQATKDLFKRFRERYPQYNISHETNGFRPKTDDSEIDAILKKYEEESKNPQDSGQIEELFKPLTFEDMYKKNGDEGSNKSYKRDPVIPKQFSLNTELGTEGKISSTRDLIQKKLDEYKVPPKQDSQYTKRVASTKVAPMEDTQKVAPTEDTQKVAPTEVTQKVAPMEDTHKMEPTEISSPKIEPTDDSQKVDSAESSEKIKARKMNVFDRLSKK
ncbi:uncharacterized protein LOC143083830 [Mytilus galloprovincialis]|uniref:uncharacterized protein LOC143083830 n=1 Tax=Mytilus galloprovincialis TaxID=29158 RepID=UPI003F7CA5AD